MDQVHKAAHGTEAVENAHGTRETRGQESKANTAEHNTNANTNTNTSSNANSNPNSNTAAVAQNTHQNHTEIKGEFLATHTSYAEARAADISRTSFL